MLWPEYIFRRMVCRIPILRLPRPQFDNSFAAVEFKVINAIKNQSVKPFLPHLFPATSRRPLAIFFVLAVMLATVRPARGEAMLELFQLTWPQITQKMPEIAEAGYDSLWLPNPGKGNSGTSSYGYDMFDPFDLGSTNQQGTVATRWGTQAQLIQMVQTAHRFGIRVYFDNVMNHRSSVVPGGLRRLNQLLSGPGAAGFPSADGFGRLSELAECGGSVLVHDVGSAEPAVAGLV